MKPSARVRFAFALLVGAALVVMPLYIRSFDPDARWERLRMPFCRGHIDVGATSPNGSATLPASETGVNVRATREGAAFPSKLSLFLKEPGREFRFSWSLDAPEGREVFFVVGRPGLEAFVRALDPEGRVCPGESQVLFVPQQ